MGILKNLLVTGAARFVNTIKGSITHAQNGMYYGTCSTAADTAAKVVELVDPTGFELKPGVMIAVKFTATNTASNVTINVEGTGAKQVWFSASVNTGSANTLFGYANRHIYYVYDGTYWVFINQGANIDNNSNTVPAAQCETAAATAAKAATCTNYTLTANTYLHFNIRYANTVAGAITMNVNGKGAKPIYINGSASSASNYTLPAGSYIAFYNGTNWYFRTDGKLQASITGDAATVSGHTVGVNVPAAAKFTDRATMALCATVGGTAAKNAECYMFELKANSYLPINMGYTNTVAGAITLNVNSTGAKPIYINGAASSANNYTLPEGIYIAYYDGTNWNFRTDEKIPGSIEASNNGTFFGVSGTEANTAAKVISLSNEMGFSLRPGVMIAVLFGKTNTATNVTLNVNNTGAKSIWYNGGAYSGSSSTITGTANKIHTYVYDGTYWCWVSSNSLECSSLSSDPTTTISFAATTQTMTNDDGTITDVTGSIQVQNVNCWGRYVSGYIVFKTPKIVRNDMEVLHITSSSRFYPKFFTAAYGGSTWTFTKNVALYLSNTGAIILVGSGWTADTQYLVPISYICQGA